MTELTDRDKAILEFELLRWNHLGSKEDAIRARFGVSATRYYQLLNVIIDKPEALRADPMLVKRLRRLRDARRRTRAVVVR